MVKWGFSKLNGLTCLKGGGAYIEMGLKFGLSTKLFHLSCFEIHGAAAAAMQHTLI